MSKVNRFVGIGVSHATAIIVSCCSIIAGCHDSKPVSRDPAAKTDAQVSSKSAGVINNGEVFLDSNQIADAGSTLASRFMAEIRDPGSLEELRDAISQRGSRGLSALQSDLAQLERSSVPRNLEIARLYFQIGTLMAYEGRYTDAVAATEKSLTLGQSAGMPLEVRANLTVVLGVFALRRGEVDNCIGCVGPSSCILPISGDAIHKKPAGSREAIQKFTEYLEIAPGDLRVRWILNIAYMTLGEYPDKVPPKYLVPLDSLASTADLGVFENVAPEVGLTSRGPNQAGGSVFDDFTGDGLPDLLTTSLDVDRGASLFVNLGNGRFEDRSDKAGLSDQVYALNVARADFDNDGDLDVVLLRGGWEMAMRMSLLRNNGNASFEDITLGSGLEEPITTETAAWGDYDNDGLVDLFVGGEYRPPFSTGNKARPDPRNRCRLYRNLGNGKFVNVADQLRVDEEQCTKGCAWGDYDDDGRLDLFVSNMNAPCRLYHQQEDGTFRDVAPQVGVAGAPHSFACWFWDYDNDGRLDIYVNDYSSSLAQFVAVLLKHPVKEPSRPRLYRNLGIEGFRDVTFDVGLDRDMMPMGCNFADLDNDGFLDLYFGTGRMALEVLVPNLMFRNQEGKKFQDITTSSKTGHLQKGHGISFADWNCDGNLDLFVEAGGAVPGDRAYNLLFQNPGHKNHWLKVKLVGQTTNRSALGARIRAVIQAPDGSVRSVYRTVGNNSSFGGNTLVESIGLQDSTSVSELQISWPGSRTTQTFQQLPADQAIEITEGVDSWKPLPQKFSKPGK